MLHGRLPDRISVTDAVRGMQADTQTALVVSLCASVIGVGAWLSLLVSQVRTPTADGLLTAC